MTFYNVLRFMVLAAAFFLAGCAADPVVVGIGPSAKNPNTNAVFVIGGGRPQAAPMYCDKGILVKKQSGEPVCIFKNRTVTNGEVNEVTIEETPTMGVRGQTNLRYGHVGQTQNGGCPPGTLASPIIMGSAGSLPRYQMGQKCY